MMKFPSEFNYRTGIGVTLLNNDGRVFIAKRRDIAPLGAWQMPQGGIDDGEELEAALFREMLEEIGTSRASIMQEAQAWHCYVLPKPLRAKFWNAAYVGQRQKWFCLRFEGEDEDINLDTAEPEFSEWRWEDPGKLVDLVVDFKKDVYRSVLTEFGLI